MITSQKTKRHIPCIDHMPVKELLVRFTARSFRKPLALCVFGCFLFGFEGRIWDLIVSVPDRCLSFYFVSTNAIKIK